MTTAEQRWPSKKTLKDTEGKDRRDTDGKKQKGRILIPVPKGSEGWRLSELICLFHLFFFLPVSQCVPQSSRGFNDAQGQHSPRLRPTGHQRPASPPHQHPVNPLFFVSSPLYDQHEVMLACM